MGGIKGRLVTGTLVLLLTIVLASTASAQRITVWWTNFGPGLEVSIVRDHLVPKFEAETGISVDFSVIDPPAMIQHFAAGQGPDILLTWLDLGLSSAWQDFLIPLDPFLARWDGARFIPDGLIRRSHVDHQIYAMPFNNNLYGIYAYHKGVFADSGLNPSMPPQSWEELLEVVQRTSHIGTTGLDMTQWTAEQVFVLFLYQNGGRMWTDDFNEVLFDRSEGIEALEIVANLYQAAHPPEASGRPRLSQSIPFSQHSEALGNGKIAMFMGYNSNLAQFIGREEIGYFAGQRSPAHEPNVIAEPHGLAITRFASNPVDAWRFIEWFFQPEITIQYHQATDTLATRADLADWVWEFTPQFLQFYQYTPYAMLQPRTPDDIPVSMNYDWWTFDSMWQSVLEGNTSAEEALNSVASDFQRRIDEARD